MSHTAYNGLGRPVSATLPVGVTSTRTGDFSVPTTNRTTRTTYLADPLMRTATVTAPGQTTSSSLRYGKGDLTRVNHANRYETVTDELGRRVTSHFDRWGQLTAAIADSGGTDETTTRFAYDGLGRLVKSTAPMGDATTYVYDVHGDMTSRTQPDAGTTRYKYDSRHNVRFSQNAQQATDGKVSYFTYDRFSRMIRSGEVTRAFSSLDANQAYPFETDAASWTSRYTYDASDLVASGGSGASRGFGAARGSSASRGPDARATYPVGRPTRIEQNTDADAAAEVTARIAYDHEGRVIRRRVTIDTLPAKDVFYRYDLAGKVTAMVYPDGSETRYAYDAAGRLAGVTDAGGNALAAYAYDNDGRMSSHAVGGTLATGAYAYNTRDWVTGIDYPSRFTLSQAYDAVGNVTSQSYRRATSEARRAASYTYDGLHRLKTFRQGSTHARTYAYDDNGNITRVVTGSDTATYAYTRASTPNRLDRITKGTKIDRFRYDANGSATSVAGAALTYDHRGLVTGYGAYGYALDAEGYRVKKTGGGSTVYYVRGAGGSVLATYDGAGNLTANYLYAGGDRLARVAGGVVSYYLKDHLGSTRTLLSSGGTAAATYDYWPYGEVLATGGTDATPFKFTGHERDAESGLDFMPNRTYGPVARRFWQVDPMAHKLPSWSPYVYSFNNPLIFRDPTGAIAYPIYIRSFAPKNVFDGYHGDGGNRGFTTSLSATARIHQKINFDTDKTSITTQARSSPTRKENSQESITGTPSAYVDVARIARHGDSRTFHFGTHAYGKNPDVWEYVSPNLDLFSNFTITESDGLLSISGYLTGDDFPATEAFIMDPNGQSVFIGVGVYEGSAFSMLPGLNRRAITSFRFGITTDSDGNFTGVRSNGKDYSIHEWNKLFERQNPNAEQDDK